MMNRNHQFRSNGSNSNNNSSRSSSVPRANSRHKSRTGGDGTSNSNNSGDINSTGPHYRRSSATTTTTPSPKKKRINDGRRSGGRKISSLLAATAAGVRPAAAAPTTTATRGSSTASNIELPQPPPYSRHSDRIPESARNRWSSRKKRSKKLKHQQQQQQQHANKTKKSKSSPQQRETHQQHHRNNDHDHRNYHHNGSEIEADPVARDMDEVPFPPQRRDVAGQRARSDHGEHDGRHRHHNNYDRLETHFRTHARQSHQTGHASMQRGEERQQRRRQEGEKKDNLAKKVAKWCGPRQRLPEESKSKKQMQERPQRVQEQRRGGGGTGRGTAIEVGASRVLASVGREPVTEESFLTRQPRVAATAPNSARGMVDVNPDLTNDQRRRHTSFLQHQSHQSMVPSKPTHSPSINMRVTDTATQYRRGILESTGEESRVDEHDDDDSNSSSSSSASSSSSSSSSNGVRKRGAGDGRCNVTNLKTAMNPRMATKSKPKPPPQEVIELLQDSDDDDSDNNEQHELKNTAEDAGQSSAAAALILSIQDQHPRQKLHQPQQQLMKSRDVSNTLQHCSSVVAEKKIKKRVTTQVVDFVAGTSTLGTMTDTASTNAGVDSTRPKTSYNKRSSHLPVTSTSSSSSSSTTPKEPPAPAKRRTACDDNNVVLVDSDDDGVDVDIDPMEESCNQDEIPSMEVLKEKCWKCEVSLRIRKTMSSHTNQDDIEATYCGWYVMHEHSLLQTPVCCICDEEIRVTTTEDFHDSQEENKDDNGDKEASCVPAPVPVPASTYTSAPTSFDRTTYCSGCGRLEDEVESLFLCDNVRAADDEMQDDCGRAFCCECVAKCHGGGRPGVAKAKAVEADESPWLCPLCNPPPELQQLQEHQQQQKLEHDLQQQDDDAGARTVDVVLEELTSAEEEKRRTLCILDKKDEKLLEIREELQRSVSGKGAHNESVEAAARSELGVWEKPWWDHLRRVEDCISTLHDVLDLKHGIDVTRFYIQEENPITLGSSIPDWVVTANEENRKRQEQMKPVDCFTTKKETYDEVEYLYPMDEKYDDDEDLKAKRAGWRADDERPSTTCIEEAHQNEDEVLAQRSICIAYRDEKHDEEEQIKLESALVRNHDKGVHACRRGRRSDFCPDHAQQSPHPTANVLEREEGMYAEYFEGSSLVLCHATGNQHDRCAHQDAGDTTCVRTVAVAKLLSEKLKAHQIEGVRHMWRNSFSDFARHEDGNAHDVGGCVLAHGMGTGKSLQAIALLHTVLTHPELFSKKTQKQLLHSALLIVPVNALANWEAEFDKWTNGLKPDLLLDVIRSSGEVNRIRRWSNLGGVLLMTTGTLRGIVESPTCLDDSYILQADILVMDEAHLMLTRCNKTSKALQRIKTRRKVALTGTPFSNNLQEYFRMINFVRPSAFGYEEESTFEKQFTRPIVAGVLRDATEHSFTESLRLSKLLKETVQPYVHRVASDVLEEELPHRQQVVLHVRQSRLQSRMYQMHLQRKDKRDFMQDYQDLRPIHNHPAALLPRFKARGVGAAGAAAISPAKCKRWWESLLEEKDENEMTNGVEHGGKVLLLLHILAHADSIGDKVLVFSQCKRTLNYLEYVLGLDWTLFPSVRKAFPKNKLGEWTKSRDYFRIDGDVNATERGRLVTQFNNKDCHVDVKAFLLSSLAGGVGINLVAANRVVVFDTHFNPTIDLQAIYRVYRYGQKKDVFCYRLLMEGSVEEKVYGRSVNKSGLALRVIDDKNIHGCFSKREVEDLQENLMWVACDECNKWRMWLDSSQPLPGEKDRWVCSMNAADPDNDSCEKEERDAKWYLEKHSPELIVNDCRGEKQEAMKSAVVFSEGVQVSSGGVQDEILHSLLLVKRRGTQTPLISRHYFHEALLDTHELSVTDLPRNGSAGKGRPIILTSPMKGKRPMREKAAYDTKGNHDASHVEIHERNPSDRTKGKRATDLGGAKEQIGASSSTRKRIKLIASNRGSGVESKSNGASKTAKHPEVSNHASKTAKNSEASNDALKPAKNPEASKSGIVISALDNEGCAAKQPAKPQSNSEQATNTHHELVDLCDSDDEEEENPGSDSMSFFTKMIVDDV